MKKSLLRRLGSLCTGAVMAMGSLISIGTTPVTVNAADTDNYAKLLQYSLYFYDANMCGNCGSTTAMDWRGNCHLQDDIVGGYHDAGDHVMFGLPQGYAASTIAWSYYEFKEAYTKLGLSDHFKTIYKYFTDYFKASTVLNGNNVSRFLYQKGEGNEDHMYWGAPESQGGSRRMYWTNNGASDIAAEYAAALALDYILFNDSESLTYAKALYNFSCQNNQVATEGVQGFYLSNDAKCSDDQAWAAAWLHIATGEANYLNDAKSKVTQYLGWAHAWGNTDLGAACMIAEITNDWSKVNSYIGSVCNGSNYLCMDGWGSARYNCCMQFVSLVASKHSSADYASWAKGQMNIILGQNNWNTSFVVGWDDKSPTHCHHRAASGLSNAKDSAPNQHVLVGALVGGPNKSGQYSDNREDYETNEVALDYQAGLVGAAAALYDKFGTGSTVTSIPGVKSVNPTPSDPIVTTTTPYNPTPSVTTTPAPTNPSTGGTKEATYTGGDASWNIDVTGATKLTVTLKTNSSDTEANGRFVCNGVDTRYEANPVNGLYTIEFDVPAGATSVTLDAWWPTSATIESAILTMGGGSQPDTKPSTTTTTTTRTTTTTTSTTTTTTSSSSTTTTTTAPYQPQPNKLGDVNCDGKIDVSDAVLLARFKAEDREATITDTGKANADVTRDGKLETDDVTKILRYIALLIDNF